MRRKWTEQIERGWQPAQRGEVVDGEKAMVAAKDRIRARAKKRA